MNMPVHLRPPTPDHQDIPMTMLCGGRVLVEHAPNGACVLSRALAPPSPNFWDAAGLRPITVLSALYRCWSKTRCRQLKPWLLRLFPQGIFALRAGQGLTTWLWTYISALLEKAELAGEWCAGISYDFAKCYDHIVPEMAIDTLLYRGAPLAVVQGLRAFYKTHVKHFKLGQAFSKAYTPANGIIQGDPLSNFLLASLVACWLERLQNGRFATHRVEPRVYVDDISATVIAADLQSLRAGLRDTHDTVRAFASFTGGLLNNDKCFTYGSSAVANGLPAISHHKDTFRLVGGSFNCGTQSSWTPLLQQRVDGWLASVSACSKLPLGWRDRLRAQQQLLSKLTWGQGTHELSIPKSRLQTMRASITRAVLRIKYYSLTPMVLFSVVAPPTLEPLFALQFAALQALQRFCRDPVQKQFLVQHLAAPGLRQRGPLGRAQQFANDPIYDPALRHILSHDWTDRSWEHSLRERWRQEQWRQIELLRQDFHGLTRVDRSLATALLQNGMPKLMIFSMFLTLVHWVHTPLMILDLAARF